MSGRNDYRPERRDRDRDYDDRRDHDNRQRRDYDSYRAPPPRDSYASTNTRADYDHYNGGGGGSFAFRGAAAREPRDDYNGGGRHEYDSYQPRDAHPSYDAYHPQVQVPYPAQDRRDVYHALPRPEERFTFNAPGAIPAPNFPPVNSQPTQPRAMRKARAAPSPARKPPGKNQRPWWQKPKPAHDRALLTRVNREPTPEQLDGMNSEENPRFATIESLREAEGIAEDGAPVKKRVKIDADVDRPQWSNPDPYTALPPPPSLGGPTIDFVQAIRNAKSQVAKDAENVNAIRDNDDFIAFDSFEFESTSAPLEPTSVPPPPTAGGKRKRVEPEDIETNSQTPWFTDDSFTSDAGLRLHQEIEDFHAFVTPSPYEQAVREQLIERVQRIMNNFPGGRGIQVRSFGSFASGLYLPTADMDLVAVSVSYMSGGKPTFCQSKNKMFALGGALERGGVVKTGSLAVIAMAKVPIVKFVDSQTGLLVDISFENDSGLRAIPVVQSWKELYPEMPNLVVIIKQLMYMHEMNEVRFGGIGGFTIICLVVSMFQMWDQANPLALDRLDPASRLGHLLQTFLDLYGHKFNIEETGIMLNPPRYFNKHYDAHLVQAKINPSRLTVIDPNRADNDLSGGSKRIGEVFACFANAHAKIQRRLADLAKGVATTSSVLGSVLASDYTHFHEQRETLMRAYEGPGRRSLPGDSHQHGGRQVSNSYSAHNAPGFMETAADRHQGAGSSHQQAFGLPPRPPPVSSGYPPPHLGNSGYPPPPARRPNLQRKEPQISRPPSDYAPSVGSVSANDEEPWGKRLRSRNTKSNGTKSQGIVIGEPADSEFSHLPLSRGALLSRAEIEAQNMMHLLSDVVQRKLQAGVAMFDSDHKKDLKRVLTLARHAANNKQDKEKPGRKKARESIENPEVHEQPGNPENPKKIKKPKTKNPETPEKLKKIKDVAIPNASKKPKATLTRAEKHIRREEKAEGKRVRAKELVAQIEQLGRMSCLPNRVRLKVERGEAWTKPDVAAMHAAIDGTAMPVPEEPVKPPKGALGRNAKKRAHRRLIARQEAAAAAAASRGQ